MNTLVFKVKSSVEISKGIKTERNRRERKKSRPIGYF